MIYFSNIPTDKLIILSLLLNADYLLSHHTNIKSCKSGEFNYLLRAAYDPYNKTFMTKSQGIVFQEHLPQGTKVFKKGEGKDDSENDGKEDIEEESKLTIIYSESKCGEFYIIESIKCS